MGIPLRWFRLWNEVLDDHKIQSLPVELRWGWLECLCLANRNGGVLPPVHQAAYALRRSEMDTQRLFDQLVGQNLLDIQPDKSLIPHNWHRRQFKSDSSRDRMRLHRSHLKVVK
jgi:hypothetical protein